MIPNHENTDCNVCADNSEKHSPYECLCSEGYFTYEEDSNVGNTGVCTKCPTGARCEHHGLTAEEVEPEKGYWLDTDTLPLLSFVACRAEESCEGEREKCGPGYDGILCSECVEGYGRLDEYECQKCESNYVALGIWVVFSTITSLIFVLIALNEAETSLTLAVRDGHFRERSTEFAKILLNAIQFNATAGSFTSFAVAAMTGVFGFLGKSLEWIMRIQRYIGYPNYLLSFDCLHQEIEHSWTEVPRAIYLETMLALSEPVLLPIIAMLIIFLITRKCCCGGKLVHNEEDEWFDEMGAHRDSSYHPRLTDDDRFNATFDPEEHNYRFGR
jgi:hypothetical protein